jgi:hypothetical protein
MVHLPLLKAKLDIIVDMDVGVVCIVQSGAPKPAKEEQESDIETTRISVQWYS